MISQNVISNFSDLKIVGIAAGAEEKSRCQLPIRHHLILLLLFNKQCRMFWYKKSPAFLQGPAMGGTDHLPTRIFDIIPVEQT